MSENLLITRVSKRCQARFLGPLALGLVLLGTEAVKAQNTVFSANFDKGVIAADVGTLRVGGQGVPSIVPVATHGHSDTDWGRGALFTDRFTSNAGFIGPGFEVNWGFTSPISLEGATVRFETIAGRIGGALPGAKRSLLRGYDSRGRILFGVVFDQNSDQSSVEVSNGFVDVPSAGAHSFIGRNRPGDPLDDALAGIFEISTTNTGWTLRGQASEGSLLSDFVIPEIPYFTQGRNLARIEIKASTGQAGTYWDNFLVQEGATNQVVPEPASLSLLLGSLATCVWWRRRRSMSHGALPTGSR